MIPKRFKVKENRHDTPDTFTLTLVPLEEKTFSFLPGQFNMLYHFGFGEVPISICGDYANTNELVHTIRAVGSVTKAMQLLKKGDEIGVRGPFGSTWPLSKPGGDVLVITGGLGFAPLRPVLIHLAKHRKDYNRIVLLYGTRTPNDILYPADIEEWKKQGMEVSITVDRASETWKGSVGVVTTLIGKQLMNPKKTMALTCGPEIMMKYSIEELARSGVSEKEIFLSMERNMKCGVGFCGHCQYAPYFLCKEGPIFSFDRVKDYFNVKEL